MPIATSQPPPHGERAPATGRWPARLKRGLVPALLAGLLAYPFPHFDFLNHPNELSRLAQVRAIVDDGTLAVNAQVDRMQRATGRAMGDLSTAFGRRFPNKAPGISFAGVPVYAALKLVRGGAAHVPDRALLYFLRLFCSALPTLLVLRPLRRYAARVSGDARAADAAALVYAFGTLALPYSLMLFSHQLSANLAIASFLALDRARRGERPWAWQLVAGLLAGYAVVTEYTLAPVAAMLLVHGALTSPRGLSGALWIGLGALPCAIGLGLYHHAAYHDALSTGYRFVENPEFHRWHSQGFMGVSWPRASSLAGNLFSASRGLFAFSPALLFALWGLRAHAREAAADAALAFGVVAFYLYVAAAFLFQAWGWMLGPRHLAPMMPFLVAPLACFIALVRRRAQRAPGWNLFAGLLAGLCAVSILVNGFCSAVFPQVPEEFTAALAHLHGPLAARGLLPYNLAELAFGKVLPWTWAPWFLGLGLVAWAAAVRVLERPRWWPSIVAGVAASAAFVAVLLLAVPAASPRERTTVDDFARQWEPADHNVRRGLF